MIGSQRESSSSNTNQAVSMALDSQLNCIKKFVSLESSIVEEGERQYIENDENRE